MGDLPSLPHPCRATKSPAWEQGGAVAMVSSRKDYWEGSCRPDWWEWEVRTSCMESLVSGYCVTSSLES